MKIGVFGLGFVGLTTAVGLAQKGFRVVGYDINQSKVESLKEAKIPFYEAGLQEALEESLGKSFSVTSDIIEVLKEAKVLFYCIGTPMADNGDADLSALLKALEDTIKSLHFCDKKPILLIKSTVPPSSCEEVFIPFLNSLNVTINKDYILANNPEFLREGFAYYDFEHPDRVVIGTQDSQPLEELETIYKPFGAEIFFVSLNSAEFIKYLSNITLSLNISFANEMSMIAQHIGNIDIIKSFKILHKDKRFSGNPALITSYLYPGMGFGGYCLPKDTLALYKKSKDKGYEAKIIKDILEVNAEILDFYVKKITKEVKNNQKIGILGLSFKPGSDDVRDSKSALLVKELLARGYLNLYAYDPMAMDIFSKTYHFNISYCKNLQEIIKECEVLVIATAWEEFFSVLESCRDKVIYNLRWIENKR